MEYSKQEVRRDGTNQGIYSTAGINQRPCLLLEANQMGYKYTCIYTHLCAYTRMGVDMYRSQHKNAFRMLREEGKLHNGRGWADIPPAKFKNKTFECKLYIKRNNI